MEKVVQKFGGTSLNSDKKRKLAAKKVKNSIEKGFSPVVVVSAMGRFGDAYATDTLINIAKKYLLKLIQEKKIYLCPVGK